MNKIFLNLPTSEYNEESPDYSLDIHSLGIKGNENYNRKDNKFGWNVANAEIYFDNTTKELLEYKLLSMDKIEQSHAKKIETRDITYWHFEFIDRKLNVSPDPFEPKFVKFVTYYYTSVFRNDDLLKKELSLPIVSYELLSCKKQLIQVRYSLVASDIDSKPLFNIFVKNGLIQIITDWQTNKTKKTVYPTPNYSDYIVQSDNSFKRLDVTNCEEKELIFKGFNDYSVKYLTNSDTEKELQKYGFFIPELRNIINAPELLLKYIPTVNYHLIKNCNMRCQHCFSDFSEVLEDKINYTYAKQIIQELSKIKSFRKLNFSGGEPTMFKRIEQLIKFAKELNFETSMVTNGYILLKSHKLLDELKEYLDILAFSIDSFDHELNVKKGRRVGKKKKETISHKDFLQLAQRCNDYGIKIKVNTVISSLNCSEFLANKIVALKPIRWKILRMLPVKSQNDEAVNYFPTDEEYNNFIINNKKVAERLGVKVVTEDNEDMTGSYLMISPDGKFFNNIEGCHKYSKAILDVGIKTALNETPLLREVFYKREGNYSCK